MAEGTGSGDRLSIWFFVGSMTLLYGIVLTIIGVVEWNSPPANEVALGWLVALHPTFWWGLLLLVFGGTYVVKFWPRPGDERKR